MNPYQDLWRRNPTYFFIENRQSFQVQFLTSRETAWCSKSRFHIKFTSSGEKIIGIITIPFFTTPCAKNNSLLRFLFWTFLDDIFSVKESFIASRGACWWFSLLLHCEGVIWQWHISLQIWMNPAAPDPPLTYTVVTKLDGTITLCSLPHIMRLSL